jgi:hypothetical protein
LDHVGIEAVAVHVENPEKLVGQGLGGFADVQ